MHEKTLPVSVSLLGYGGLIPFIAMAILSIADPAHRIIYCGALLLYGVVILSFVGAIHWGAAMFAEHISNRNRRTYYVWSVVPALVGWSTCILAPAAACLVLVLGFLLQYSRDVSARKDIEWPNWYLPLRARLTIIACVSLLLGFFWPLNS